MNSSIIKPGVVLLAFAAVAAALLGYVNAITAAPIAEQDRLTAAAAMQKVMPEAKSFDDDCVVSDTAIAVRSYNVARDEKGDIVGYAVTAASKGYGGDVVIMVGIKADGTINAIDVTDNSNETPGLGANSSNDDFKSQYEGKTADKEIKVVKTPTDKDDEIQAITSATITSRAVTNSVNEVLKFYNDNLKGGGVK